MFTITTTKKCPPKSKKNINSLNNQYERTDKYVQEINLEIYKFKLFSKFIDKFYEQKKNLLFDPKMQLYMLRSLIFEAKKKDISLNKDKAIITNLIEKWNRLANQMEQNFFEIIQKKSKLDDNDIKKIEFLFDKISILGIWFNDIPSPAIGRRECAITELYFNLTKGVDIKNKIKILDKLILIDKGELSISDLTEEENAIIIKMKELYPISETKFEMSYFVMHSRKIRQMMRLYELKISNKKFLSEIQNKDEDEDDCIIFVDLIDDEDDCIKFVNLIDDEDL